MSGTVRRFAVRTIKDVPLSFDDSEGNLQTETFTVRYHSFSPTRSRELAELEAAPDASAAKSLSRLMESIRDAAGDELTGDDGNAIPMTEEGLESLGIENLQTLYSRITKAVNPTKQPPSPVLPSTSAVPEPAAGTPSAQN